PPRGFRSRRAPTPPPAATSPSPATKASPFVATSEGQSAADYGADIAEPEQPNSPRDDLRSEVCGKGSGAFGAQSTYDLLWAQNARARRFRTPLGRSAGLAASRAR